MVNGDGWYDFYEASSSEGGKMPSSILSNQRLLATLSWEEIDDLMLTNRERWLLKGDCSLDDIEYLLHLCSDHCPLHWVRERIQATHVGKGNSEMDAGFIRCHDRRAACAAVGRSHFACLDRSRSRERSARKVRNGRSGRNVSAEI